MLPTLLVRQDIAQQRLQQVFTDFSAPNLVVSLCIKATFTENHTRIYCFCHRKLKFLLKSAKLKDLNQPERLNFVVLPIPHPYL